MTETKLCLRCGGEFSRPYGLSASQWEKRSFCSKRCATLKRSLTDDKIIELYNLGKSCADIALLAFVSITQIQRVLRAKGQIRNPRDRQIIAAQKPARLNARLRPRPPCPQHVKDILSTRVGSKNHNWRSGLTITGGYLTFTASPANGEHAGRRLHDIIAEWKIGRPLETSEVPHHKDLNKLNNNPDNLEVITHSEHARLHAIISGLGTHRRTENERKRK